MRDALERAEMTRPVLEAVGREHQVCPFALSLDVSLWADVVICDYNYVFDPTVYLRRHFAEDAGGCALLVDEAHNLVDRAREMFSAELESREIRDAGRLIKQAAPRCARALAKLNLALMKLCGSAPPHAEAVESADPTLKLSFHPNPPLGKATDAPGGSGETPAIDARNNVRTQSELPPDLLPLVEGALKETENWLARNQPAEFRETLLQLYFRLHSFRRTAELYDEHYATIIEPLTSMRVRLFCLDPSVLLRQTLKRVKAAVFFSATLTPIGYYRALLGGAPGDRVVRLPSPFPTENLAVLIQDRIQTHFRARAGTLGDVAQAIRALVSGRGGNYLVFLPSYQYLAGVRERFQALCPEIAILVQGPGMTEPERDAFLAAFAAERGDTLVGFAVLGGVFGEGIDLTGERLVGAVIVGVGLPQLCVERNLIRDYFQVQTGAGFDYAYTFPGMNRVLQAIGRVIRSETDCGVALLIDTRFAESRYRRLFPKWWETIRTRSVDEIRAAADGFWKAP
jgi:DNA excision repair protein ERCC-2